MVRFGNPDISDLVSRLCQDGSKKFQGFVVPAMQEMLHEGTPTPMVEKVVASWYVYLGEWEAIDDPAGDTLVTLAQKKDLKEFLSVALGVQEETNAGFCSNVAKEVAFLTEEGPRAFLKRC